jgi:nucleotide-binding universal stress UspA family protein
MFIVQENRGYTLEAWSNFPGQGPYLICVNKLPPRSPASLHRGYARYRGTACQEKRMYQNILVATDGSARADKAVSHGISLAKSVGAKITALIVEGPIDFFSVPESQAHGLSEAFEEHAEHLRQHATSVLDNIADAAKTAGVPCETIQLEHEHPYEAIISTAKDKGCDLIVMASHGRSGISAVLLGSVTNKVLAHTSIPVLVCH